MSGVQPQQDGRLECLECGRWFRLLPPHLGPAHTMSAAEYREAHQLPRKLSLRGRDLAERARAQSRARYAAREDIRAAMDRGRASGPGPAAVRSSQETARRPGVVEARRRGGRGKRAAERRRADEPARVLGYPDLAAYFADRLGASKAEMARELGLSRTAVCGWLGRLQGEGDIERANGAARRAAQAAYLRALLDPAAPPLDPTASSDPARGWRQDDETFAAAADAIHAYSTADTAHPAPRGAAARRKRQAAYLAALLEPGATHNHALAAVQAARSTAGAWRAALPEFDSAIEAIRRYQAGPGQRTPGRDHRYHTTEAQFEAHLAALAQGLGPNQAQAASGATRSAVRYRAQRDPQFAARLNAIRPPGRSRLKPIDEQWLRTAWADPTLTLHDIATTANVSEPTLTARARALELGPRRGPRGPAPQPIDQQWLRTAWADPTTTIDQIANRTGLSRTQLHNRARALGLGPRRGPRGPG